MIVRDHVVFCFRGFFFGSSQDIIFLYFVFYYYFYFNFNPDNFIKSGISVFNIRNDSVYKYYFDLS